MGTQRTSSYRVPAEPPEEILAWFRSKKLEPSFDYRDVWKEQHVTAFTVAKAMDLDILSDIKQAVDESIEKGIPFQEFKKNLANVLDKKGWWGKKEMVDPKTGEKKIVQLGSVPRLRKIFDTNLRTARAAGKWQRIVEAKKTHPYLLRRLGAAKEHRPLHVKQDGLCLPVEHPHWKKGYPPDGWGCMCYVVQLTVVTYEKYLKEGVTSSISTPVLDANGQPTGRITKKIIPLITKAPVEKLIPWKNARTGQTEYVPEGIDPGWDYNVGMVGQAKVAQDKFKQSADLFEKLVGNMTRAYKAWFSTTINLLSFFLGKGGE